MSTPIFLFYINLGNREKREGWETEADGGKQFNRYTESMRETVFLFNYTGEIYAISEFNIERIVKNRMFMHNTLAFYGKWWYAVANRHREG